MKSLALLLLLAAAGCDDEAPLVATVTNVVDGDTVDIDTGERVRYLLVDTPELDTNDCWATEAREANRALVLDQRVELRFDAERKDRFGRLLAYVTVAGVEVNSRLVERGHACVLHVPPNGDDRVGELEDLEVAAKAAGRGMWGACTEVLCD